MHRCCPTRITTAPVKSCEYMDKYAQTYAPIFICTCIHTHAYVYTHTRHTEMHTANKHIHT